jgi:SNF2 family DNA or RNA helicase
MILASPFPSRPLWALRSSYFSPKLQAACKEVPGLRWHAPSTSWVGYPDAVDAVKRLLEAQGLRIEGPKDLLLHLSEEEAPYLPLATKGQRSYQKAGSIFLLNHHRGGGLIADAPRLGKSNQALIAARALSKRTLIVCPSHVVGVWARSAADAKPPRPCEVERWWPDAYNRGVWTPEGTKPSDEVISEAKRWAEEGLVVVIHYDILYAWAEVLKTTFQPGIVVFDEIHMLQSETSRRSGAAGVVVSGNPAPIIWGASGTPMTNRPRDLFSTINLLSPSLGPDLPPRFGDNFFRFVKRYCSAYEKTVGKGAGAKTVWDFSGASNLDELHRRLRFFMLRRTKSEVMTELPKETRQVVELVAPRKFTTPILPSLASPKMARRALELAADGALPQMIAALEETALDGTKLIAFTHRRAVAEHVEGSLRAAGLETALIHGLVPQRKREALIQAARESPGPHILVATIDATSTGIDLSYASHAFYLELPWELTDLLQSKERLFRVDQLSPIFITFFVTRGTVVELVLAKLLKKLDLFESVVGKIGDDKLKADLLGESGDDALAGYCKEVMKDLEQKSKKKGKTR